MNGWMLIILWNEWSVRLWKCYVAHYICPQKYPSIKAHYTAMVNPLFWGFAVDDAQLSEREGMTNQNQQATTKPQICWQISRLHLCIVCFWSHNPRAFNMCEPKPNYSATDLWVQTKTCDASLISSSSLTGWVCVFVFFFTPRWRPPLWTTSH